jgi:hypothetical protein
VGISRFTPKAASRSNLFSSLLGMNHAPIDYDSSSVSALSAGMYGIKPFLKATS